MSAVMFLRPQKVSFGRVGEFRNRGWGRRHKLVFVEVWAVERLDLQS